MKLGMLKPLLSTIDTRTVRPMPKERDDFYKSPEWMALRDRVRADAKWTCQRPGCGKRGLYVDHIVELRDGGARLDRSNAELLCASCHTTKTNAERAKRTRSI